VLSLPTNWYRLSTAQQLFVILNLERTSLGFAPYLGLNAALTVEAQRAATQRRDAGEDGECGGGLRVHVFRIIFIHAERRHTYEFMSLR